MDTVAIDIDREAAMKAYQEYLKHRHYETPIDAEIKRTYHALAKGGTVIKALESIVKAGPDADGLPKLAVVRADFPRCIVRREIDGSFNLNAWNGNERQRYRPSSAADLHFKFGAGSFPTMRNPANAQYGRWRTDGYSAIVPIIPIQHRPRRALQAYHVLWEVEKWDPVHVPRDPFLLRRLGKGDLWLVVAAWDLTEVERAALQSRVSVN